MNDLEFKRCSKCGDIQDISAFSNDRARKGGKRIHCKLCVIREKNKRYWENNREELRESNKKYSKRYYENNKEKIKESRKRYWENNKEEIREKNKIYRKNNKEEIRESQKRYYENNKEEIREANKTYQENNKEKIRESDSYMRYLIRLPKEFCPNELIELKRICIKIKRECLDSSNFKINV